MAMKKHYNILIFNLFILATIFSSCGGELPTTEIGRARFTVDIVTNGGYPASYPTQLFYSAGRVVKPEKDPTKRHSMFIGWMSDISEGYYDFSTIVYPYQQHYTIYATWAEAYEVYLDAGEGVFTEPDGSTFPVDTAFVAKDIPMGMPVTSPTLAGQEFRGWCVRPEATREDYFDFSNTPINEDMTLYARYVVPGTVANISFDSRGGSAVETLIEIPVGTTIEKPTDPVKEGRTFRFWIDDEGKEFDFSVPVRRDMVLHAVWSPLPEEAFGFDPTTGQITEFKAPYCETETHLDIPETIGGVKVVGFKDAVSKTPNNPGNNYNTATTKGIFQSNTVLQSVYFPPTLTRLGQWTFAGATSLSRVYMYGLTRTLPRQGGANWMLWAKQPYYAHQPFAGSGLQELHIPSTMTNMQGNGLFTQCNQLVKIHYYGADPIQLAQYTFNACANVEVMIFEKTVPPTLPANFFGNAQLTRLKEIRVPAESVEAYKAASGWGSWSNFVIPIE